MIWAGDDLAFFGVGLAVGGIAGLRLGFVLWRRQVIKVMARSLNQSR